jgi:hypothetical protein
MKRDNAIIGLSVLLAVVVALTVFSASLPALGNTAEQNAAVTVNTTAVIVCAQNGSADYPVNYWNFTGQAGATVDNPTNDIGGTQDVGTNHKPVACLNNTNEQTMTVYINAGTFSSDTVYQELYNDSATTPSGWSSNIQGAGDITYGSLAQNVNGTLWLRVILKSAGSGASTFNVTCEA